MFTEQQLEDFGPRNKHFQASRNSEESLDMKKNIDGEQFVTKDSQMIPVAQFAVASKQDHNALPGLNHKSSKIMKFMTPMSKVSKMSQFSFLILKMKIRSKVMIVLTPKILS